MDVTWMSEWGSQLGGLAQNLMDQVWKFETFCVLISLKSNVFVRRFRKAVIGRQFATSSNESKLHFATVTSKQVRRRCTEYFRFCRGLCRARRRWVTQRAPVWSIVAENMTSLSVISIEINKIFLLGVTVGYGVNSVWRQDVPVVCNLFVFIWILDFEPRESTEDFGGDQRKFCDRRRGSSSSQQIHEASESESESSERESETIRDSAGPCARWRHYLWRRTIVERHIKACISVEQVRTILQTSL